MGRILALDYGLKRTGVAVTDPSRIIATALTVVDTPKVLGFLKDYFTAEEVDELVIGMPKRLNNQPTEMTPVVERFIGILQTNFPTKPIHEVDERFTSVMAQRAMIDGGMKKKQRRQKGNVDKISATLILQSFLEARSNQMR